MIRPAQRLWALILCVGMLQSCGEHKPAPPNAEPVSSVPAEWRKTSTPPKATDDYFKAMGTEPFWALRISPQQVELFTMEDTLRTPHAEPVRAMDANVKQYALKTEASEIKIRIARDSCINAMSGEAFPYSVWVQYRRTGDPDLKEIDGCGRYLTDYRLHDFWVLVSLEGAEIRKEDYPGEVPSLEMNASDNAFSGFTGCNRMMGELFYEPGLLRFGPTAVTKRACPGMGTAEQRFLDALEKVTSYTLAENRLTLTNPETELLVFRKMD